MTEGEKTIKVVDRRLFTADGELRDETKAELEKEDATPEAPPAAAPAPAAAEPAPETHPGFLRLLDMLGQTAALYMEGFPDPATGRRQVDLQAPGRSSTRSSPCARRRAGGFPSRRTTRSRTSSVSSSSSSRGSPPRLPAGRRLRRLRGEAEASRIRSRP